MFQTLVRVSRGSAGPEHDFAGAAGGGAGVGAALLDEAGSALGTPGTTGNANAGRRALGGSGDRTPSTPAQAVANDDMTTKDTKTRRMGELLRTMARR